MARKQTLVLVMIVVIYCDARLQNSYSKLQYGHRLDRKMIDSFVNFSILDCAEECLRTTRCKSVSYYKGTNYCETNYENKSSARDRFLESLGWIYSEKEDWDIDIVSSCWASNCSINEKCKPLPMGKFECVLSDCGIPSQLGVNLSSVGRWEGIGIGRHMELECFQNYKQNGSRVFRCQTNGQWITDLKCVKNFPKDCQDVLWAGNTKSKVYTIRPHGGGDLEVFCDQHTDRGGWTVIQRRMDGTVDFFRKWNDYKYGFGNKTGEYWLGNQRIHEIVQQGNYELRIDMSDFNGEKRYALYKGFSIRDEDHGYALHVEDYDGTAGDSLLRRHSGSQFYTKDHDSNSCANTYKGGWWYNGCHDSNLNGMYLAGSHASYADSIIWVTWHGYHYSLRTTEMKIRRS
ncbi:techylectin-5A-like [Ostrea edulis]|uniref:techylectin-5A-like n=1 Tax=Ostrea edulis TaxID=37623 RepID=UPI0024AEB7AD|nr:techylectin-5A-like [Ostrea edulis]